MHLQYYLQITCQLFTIMMPIREMYNASNKIVSHGIQGYQVEKKYMNSTEQTDSKLPKRQLKRGSYLDDYNRVHGKIPGPGVYNYDKNQWPQKPSIQREKPKKRKTYIEELMDKCKKEKQPAPGQYKIVKSLKEQDKERKENARRKRTYQDRITYLDGVQYEATLTPGVGKYNTRPKSSGTVRKDKPEDWRKKHTEQSKKKPQKHPDMGSYNPREAKSFERKPTKEGIWNRIERFKSQKTAAGPQLGPGKYNGQDEWGKMNNVIAPRTRPKSAYYH